MNSISFCAKVFDVSPDRIRSAVGMARRLKKDKMRSECRTWPHCWLEFTHDPLFFELFQPEGLMAAARRHLGSHGAEDGEMRPVEHLCSWGRPGLGCTGLTRAAKEVGRPERECQTSLTSSTSCCRLHVRASGQKMIFASKVEKECG